MRTFQPTYRDRTGNLRRAAKWYAELRNAAGVLRRVPCFTNRRASEDFGRQLVRLVNYRAAGQLPDPALVAWLEGLPGRLQALLARQGFLDGRHSAAMKPLVEHLEGAPDAPGFRQALAARGATPRHADLVVGRARRVLEGCGFTFWRDISASAPRRPAGRLGGRRSGNGPQAGSGTAGGKRRFGIFWIDGMGRAA
ncbi:MAG: hypothetical protein FJ288_00780 [Planctomycetes bacterium]|nr:hypothetical protein [Planctomycetota bacterium]